MPSFEGYPDYYVEQIYESPSLALLQDIQAEYPHLEIREEQIDCLDAIQLARIEGNEKALVQMATGLGKTTVIAADVKRFLSESPGSRVLFLCHQNRILDQARERFEDIVGPEFTYGNFTGETQNYNEVTCLFASLQAMRSWKDVFLPDDFDYVVVDESHHSMAKTYRSTIEHFKPKFMLGVTGTPDRHDMRDIRDIYGQEIYQKTLEEAIAEDRLTQADYYVVIDEIAAQQKLRDARGEKLSFRQLNRNIFIPMRDEEMARIAREKALELGQPVRRLVFCTSIEQTQEFAQYFDNAAPIHSKLSTLEIKQNLERFRSGDLETLLTVDMFNEGIDIPEINQMLFLRLTQSKAVFLQQLGRGLRKIPGKEKVQVLDFVANADRLVMLDRFRQRIYEHSGSQEVANEIFDINIDGANFNETLRDVLDILAEIEADTDLYRRLKIEGWRSVAEICEELGTTNYIIKKAIEEVGLGGRQLKNARSRVFTYYSPTQLNDIRSWLQGNYPEAPEAYLPFSELAKSLALSEPKLERIMRELDVEPELYRSQLSGRLIAYFSVEQSIQIIEHPHLSLKKAPRGYITKNQASQSLGVSFKYLTQTLEQLNISTVTYLTQKRYPSSFMSKTQFKQVASFLGDRQEAPEGSISFNQVQVVTGLADESVKRICRELSIVPQQFKNRRGHIVKFILPEDLEKITKHPYYLLGTAPDNYTSVGDIEEATGLSDSTVLSIARSFHLEWSQYKNSRGMVTRYLTPEQIDIFLTHQLINVDFAPEGYVSRASLRAELGITYSTMVNICNDLGIAVERYKDSGRGRINEYLSPEQVSFVKEHPKATLDEAPEGFMTIDGENAIMVFLGVPRARIKSAITKFGIVPHLYKNPHGKKIQEYYSPDQVELIRQALSVN